MKPQLLKITTDPVHSFSVRQDLVPYVNNRWHYHPEVELIHFHKGGGLQFVGDNIQRFHPDDIVLVGNNLPHYWYYDEVYLEDKAQASPYSTVIHFRDTFWGNQFLALPENEPIRKLLAEARRGLLIQGTRKPEVAQGIRDIYSSDGARRILALLHCLLVIAESAAYTPLSSLGFQPKYSAGQNNQINAVYDFTFKNFRNPIYLKQIAEIAGMTPNSFCRYFKTRTGKTFSQFLLEFRVGTACRLLLQDRLNIKHVCYESGFQNAASFHKTFKKITGQTPQQYQQQYRHQR
jgi:AraC-like DNA-binding protein